MIIYTLCVVIVCIIIKLCCLSPKIVLSFIFISMMKLIGVRRDRLSFVIYVKYMVQDI